MKQTRAGAALSQLQARSGPRSRSNRDQLFQNPVNRCRARGIGTCSTQKENAKQFSTRTMPLVTRHMTAAALAELCHALSKHVHTYASPQREGQCAENIKRTVRRSPNSNLCSTLSPHSAALVREWQHAKKEARHSVFCVGEAAPRRGPFISPPPGASARRTAASQLPSGTVQGGRSRKQT